MLQLEGYLSARFLRWWLSRPTRVSPSRQLAFTLVSAVLALAAGAWRGGSLLLGVGWAAVGWWLAATTRFGQARKPLVMTARARRLALGQALLAGAILAATSRRATRRPTTERMPRDFPGGTASLLTLAVLATPLLTAAANLLLYPVEEALRRYYLRDAATKLRRMRPTVVAVAGSYGKTSTKEFLATILAARYQVLKPPGSYNTPLGLARVIREQLEPRHQMLVAELGDWVPGDIAFLCRLLRPTVGVLTTIGPEHLERFGSMERVVASKFELLEALPAEGVAVVNDDDQAVRGLAERTPHARVVRYGTASSAEVRARDLRTTRDGLRFVVEAGDQSATFEAPLLGRHNAENVLAATAAALALGMNLDEVAAAVRTIEPVEHRLQPIQGSGGILVVDDSYNSNPRGAAAALDVLAEIEAGQRVLVTPGMIELGELEYEENRRFAKRAAEVCDAVIIVGRERSPALLDGLRDGQFPDSAVHVVRDLDEATARIATIVRTGDAVLFENDLPDTYADDGSRTVAPSQPSPTTRPSGLAREYLNVDGLRVAYRATGPADGQPIVLLHGWGASIDAVAPMFAGHDDTLRVLAFDLPGFGMSDPPPDAWSSEEYARLVERVLTRLGVGRRNIIGHSRGGAIALVLAARWPDRVERLVLVNSAGIRPNRRLAYRAQVGAFKLARRLAGRGPLAGWLARRFGSTDYRLAGSLRGTLVRMVNEDPRPLLPAVRAPTLLIWGDQDEETPLSDAAIMEREIPDAGLVVFAGAGHFAYADDLPRFQAVVGHFLKS